jgi:dihydrolipoamide dehydrogenase
MSKSFDVVIIGGGPGGYVAAIRASQLGFTVSVIEKEKLGGVCLNWGCIPTKALLKSAEVYHMIKSSQKYGISISGDIKINFKDVISRSRAISAQLSNGIKSLMKKHKIEVINGYAKLLGNGKIAVENQEISAQHIILATGSRPRILANIPIDNKFVWDYKDAMIPEEIPETLLIIGAGAIGMEYASFYNDMECAVTVVEVADRVLMSEDEEISALAQKEFEKRGITVITSATLDMFAIVDDKVSIRVNGKMMEFNRVISAAGVIPNTDNLGLEHTKVKLTQSGHIITNEWMASDEPGVYAIGDITQPPFLAHKASHEAIVCLEKIANHNPHPILRDKIPGCIYSRPQIASIGISESKAIAAGYQINVGRFPFIGNGKAIAIGESQGLIKTIFDKKTGEILGVHMIGAEVTEMIGAYVVAKTAELTDLDIIRTIFPHPTLSEMLHESALQSIGMAIHI